MDDTEPFNTLGIYAKSTMIALQELQSAGWQPVDDGIVRLLLAEGAEVNAQGGQFANALQVASLEGQERIVQLLLEKGAEGNSRGGEYGNALQAASRERHDSIVHLLLEKGAEFNAQAGGYGNVFQVASFEE